MRLTPTGSNPYFVLDSYVIYGEEIVPVKPELSYSNGAILIDNYHDAYTYRDIVVDGRAFTQNYGPLEYSLDGGAWADYETSTGIAAGDGAHSVRVRFGGVAQTNTNLGFFVTPGFTPSQASPAGTLATIIVTGVTTGDGQASMNFGIKSANGKGYTVHLSETGIEGSFKPYGDVNFNSMGAHIKGLTNGRKYYAYIEYDDGKGNILRSKVASFTPNKYSR